MILCNRGETEEENEKLTNPVKLDDNNRQNFEIPPYL